jgi:hypothetical protein
MEKQKSIDNIIDNFNWDRVQKVMEFLDWKWYGSCEGEVPTIGPLIRQSMDLLNKAYDLCEQYKEITRVGTGGLYAMAFWDDEEKEVYHLELYFALSSWEEYND